MVDLAPIEKAMLFYGLSGTELGTLGLIAEEVPMKLGERIFARGDTADALYLTRKGQLALTIGLRVFDDAEEMLVEELHSGDAFGWSTLVEPHQWLYSAFCTEDGSLIRFPREELEQLISNDHGLGYKLRTNIGEVMGRRLRTLQETWIAEVEQSMARVQHWTSTRENRQLRNIIRTAQKTTSWSLFS